MKKLIFVFLFFALVQTKAQQKLTKAQLDSLPNTIENHFVKTLGKAKVWNQYKMITKADFKKLQAQIIDSVAVIKKQINAKEAVIKDQQTTITSLNTKVNDLNESVTEYKGKENAKNGVKGILYGLIGLLALTTAFFAFKFKNSNTITKNAKKNLIDTEQEFEQHKKRSLEREQQLRRKLQDEINKQRGV